MNIKKIFLDGLTNIKNDQFQGNEIDLEIFFDDNKKEILHILEDKKIQAEVSNTINYLQLNKKNFLLSLVYLNLFCEKFPNNNDLKLVTSKTYFQCGIYELALINLNKIPRKVYSIEHYQVLINIYFQLEYFQECVESIKKIRLLEGINSTNTLLIINCLKRLKNINEAKLELENLKKFHHDDFELFYNQISIELLENKFEAVLQKLRNAEIKYSNKEVRFHEIFSLVLSKFRNFNEAISQLEVAHSLGSKNLNHFFCNLYFNQNDFKNGYIHLKNGATDTLKEKVFLSHKFKKWNFENLDESLLFVYTGRGLALGDKIYFYRYLIDIKKRYKNLEIYLCSNNFRDKYLFNNNNIKFIKFDEIRNFHNSNKSSYFSALPLIADIYHEKLSIENLKSFDYLPLDIKRENFWKNYIDNFKNEIKVGINWKGNIKYKYDAYRSLEIKELESLFSIKKITFFILNNKLNSDENDFISKFDNVILIGEENFKKEKTNSFIETIEIMRNLDIIISSDTSIAHIASTLNLTTYLILEYSPFWYFNDELKNSVYQNIDLTYFNQDRPGNWDSAIKKIEKKLKTLI